MPFVSSPLAHLDYAALPHKTPTAHAGAGAHPLPSGYSRVLDPSLCDATDQANIKNAFWQLATTYIPEIARHGGDWLKLADCMKTKTDTSLNISCDPFYETPIVWGANTKPQWLNLASDTSNLYHLEGWLIVAVVHLCGGYDLDAWAIWNWLFNVSWRSYPYAYLPIINQNLMCAGSTKIRQGPAGTIGYTLYYRAGNFTVWDNVAGNLWPSEHHTTPSPFGTQITTVSPHGTSLIDAGAPRTLWQHAC